MVRARIARGAVWLAVAAILAFIVIRAIFYPLNHQSDRPLAVLAFFLFVCVTFVIALRSCYRAFGLAWNRLPDPVTPLHPCSKPFLCLAWPVWCSAPTGVKGPVAKQSARLRRY